MVRLCAFADEASPWIEGQIEALKRNGISLLEIRGVDEKNISEISVNRAKEVRRMLDAEGISVWSMGSPIGKISLGEAFAPHVDIFKRIVEYADLLGASKIRLFSFFPLAGENEEVTLERVLERMNHLCELTPDHITLCHENEKRIYGETPERCLRLHRALPKLRAVFDPANFVQCNVDTIEAWEMLKDHVEYMHVKDAQEDHMVVPAGCGIGNIPVLIKEYLGRGGQVLTLEPHLTVFTGLDKLEGGESLKRDLRQYATNDEAFDAGAIALKKITSSLC